MPARNRRDANSQDFQLMFLKDVNAAPTIADGDLLIFDEATESFVPFASAYGSMWVDDAVITMTIAGANIEAKVTGGLSTGALRGFTFQNARELRCSIPGVYEVDWGMSVSSTVNNQNLSGGVVIGLAGWVHSTEGSCNQNNSNNAVHIGGTGIITLAAGDTVGLFVENESAGTNITVRHANLTLTRIGV